MSVDSQYVSSQRPVLELKSSSLTVPLLVLNISDLQKISDQLAIKIKQAPEFFKNSPVLIDLQALAKGESLDVDIKSLVDTVSKQKLIPIGIRGGNQAQNKASVELGIPVQSAASINISRQSSKPKKIETAPVASKDADDHQTKIITQPIRSGQRIYSHGDLIVLSQVSAGSEIMANGNIHVYGTLRGRALAGVQGDSNSRIFCSDLQAELVSIDGVYKISDDLNEIVQGKPVQLFLEQQNLVIEEL